MTSFYFMDILLTCWVREEELWEKAMLVNNTILLVQMKPVLGTHCQYSLLGQLQQQRDPILDTALSSVPVCCA